MFQNLVLYAVEHRISTYYNRLFFDGIQQIFKAMERIQEIGYNDSMYRAQKYVSVNENGVKWYTKEK